MAGREGCGSVGSTSWVFARFAEKSRYVKSSLRAGQAGFVELIGCTALDAAGWRVELAARVAVWPRSTGPPAPTNHSLITRSYESLAHHSRFTLKLASSPRNRVSDCFRLQFSDPRSGRARQGCALRGKEGQLTAQHRSPHAVDRGLRGDR